jgi:hypothetical protein
VWASGSGNPQRVCLQASQPRVVGMAIVRIRAPSLRLDSDISEFGLGGVSHRQIETMPH